MRFLNLGCGYEQPTEHGWVNADKADYGQTYKFDILDGVPYVWQKDPFDVVVAHHVLQMVKYQDIPAFLQQVHKVLKPGGTFRVSVPDLIGAMEAYKRGDHSYFPIVDEAEQSIDGKFCAYLTWYGEARSVFTAGYLCDVLLRNGFSEARVSQFGDTNDVHKMITKLDNREHESLIVEGTK